MDFGLTSFDVDAITFNVCFQLSWMTIMYGINMARRNGSMVDFGWPSGFTVMAIYYLVYGPGVWIHRAVLSAMYIFCGVRFMFGWVKRGHLTQEDHRWDAWRHHWQANGGFFGSTSIPFNFFCFYHCQSLTNALFMSVPLHVAATNTSPTLSAAELAGVALWVAGFIFENTADFQLRAWKVQHRGVTNAVMRDGLWAYSRHPNYFGEFCLWVAYALMAFPAAAYGQRVLLLCLPVVAYYYLVHFTGAWMAEQVSLKKRGDVYAQYQVETPLLFPWWPRKAKST
ncbi:Aste57867_20868 [Aphanomyces stellatus]|uniref:Aste57867_20868 protein n=1 Tax=Aphanomyces stellatus TaxID=120398 RepID=A0A485LKR7_9STRA|nr:hypothetical protein As57867_020800 [Aphanomyces stellatus]VFT97545.1 Aste57867_20868 [Aphanomyces stellatus]